MTWIVGIDEAGYGPNLGPFVMTSVACRVPDEHTGADLWKVLKKAVRKRASDDDPRLFIQDSKVVYSTSRGLHDLETAVLATVSYVTVEEPLPLHRYLDWLCPSHRDELASECWFTGTTLLPLVAVPAEFHKAAKRFHLSCQNNGVHWGLVRSVLVCPARFNAIVDRWGSKGAVLGQALGGLLTYNRHPDGGSEPICFFIDKHGGRNNYAAMLQQSLGEGMVVVQEEGMDRSVYRVAG